MKTAIVKIGNSQDIRIPKTLLEQAGLEGEVEVVVEDGYLVIRPRRRPRAGWESSFEEMAARGDDTLLDPASPTDWCSDDWHWQGRMGDL